MLVEFVPARFERFDVVLDSAFVGVLSKRRFLQVATLSERELYHVRRSIAQREACSVDDVRVFGPPPGVPEGEE